MVPDLAEIAKSPNIRLIKNKNGTRFKVYGFSERAFRPAQKAKSVGPSDGTAAKTPTEPE